MDIKRRLKEELSQFASYVTDKEKEVAQQFEAGTEAERINKALGRKVDRIVLDEQDKQVLGEGEVVTHEAVAKAQEAGVLALLLDSVPEAAPPAPEEPKQG